MNLGRMYQLLKNGYHWVQSHLWRIWYGRPQLRSGELRWAPPDRGLKLYGVTGTNGKTTTCYLLDSVLAARYGREAVGMLTTVAFRAGAAEEINKTKMTTLQSRQVWKRLRAMREVGVRHVAIEVTSHALDQKRLAGVRLNGAIWLNVAREHLDYHRTLESYAAAKGKIVKYLRSGAPLVVKKQDEWIEKTLAKLKVDDLRLIWFSSQEADKVEVGLSGAVNQENALAVWKLAQALGIKRKFIERGLAEVRQVPGRMEWVSTGRKGFEVVIDYAVTPDALERLYADMRRRADKRSGRVLALLGAAGLRDRGKRPVMAAVVAEQADMLVITREDPWTEPEEQIFSDLEKGLDADCRISPSFATSFAKASAVKKAAEGTDNSKGAARCEVSWRRIVDRREALRWLLSQAKQGDVVVVTGKGAEQGMAVGKEIIPWNDGDVIREILKEQSLRGTKQSHG